MSNRFSGMIFNLVICTLAAVCSATTYTIPAGTGTLSYTVTSVSKQCELHPGAYSTYDVNTYSSFSYTVSGTSTSLSGGDTSFSGSGVGTCLKLYTPATFTTSNAVITFTPSGITGGSAVVGYPGYINPKYVILGVTYAPPGPSSFVNYANSSLVGNETDLNSSFSSAYTVSIKVSAGIEGWAKGSVSGTSSTSYTQESDTSSTVSVTKQTTISDQTAGPANAYVGLNHDYDVVWLWLNPVVNITVTPTSKSVQWTGYGYSTLDQPGMDVYPVYIGWLNGDITIPSNVQSVLGRGWAAGEIWPSGQGPGLTTADYETIEEADPYWQCTPMPSACPSTVDGTRFTGPVGGENFVYQQAAVGGEPGTQTYTDVYTDTTTQGQGAKYTFAQSFAIEEVFGGSLFNINLTTTLDQSSTLTWTTQWNDKITNTTSSTSELSITGPPCVVSGSVCNPIYTGPTEFDVYEDNLYGTFLFYPIN